MIADKLRQLRLARGLSLDDLSAAIGGIVTKQAISKYEKGMIQPQSVVLNKLAAALGVKAAYLCAEPSVRIEFIGYRKSSGLLKKEQANVESYVTQALESRIRLQQSIGQTAEACLPINSFPITSLAETENVAVKIRKDWNLGSGPLSSITGVLEERLIHVIEIEAADKFDGISAVAYSNTTNTNELIAAAVVSKRGLAGERQRLNLAHELGHLVLRAPATMESEAAAFRFGAAFLAPEEAVRREFGNQRSNILQNELLLAKHKFGISAQALLYRLRNLSIINESYYKQWCIKINRLGWKRQEPEELPAEKPVWLQKNILKALGEDLISREEAEKIVGCSLENTEPLSLVKRRAFMKLPLEERRRLMVKQAEHAAAHYEKDTDWREFLGGDFIDY
jgi:transcriptional regulator with XRE-family HTH domain